MDGLNFRAPSGILEKFFSVDKYGLYSPRPELLQMDVVKRRVTRALSARTDLADKLQDRYYLTDVETTNNPYGNTNAIGAGVKMFGTQPLKGQKFRGRMEILSGRTSKVDNQLMKREARIEQYAKDVLAHHKRQEPADKDSPEYTLWEIEHDQALTGGGFDGNSVGDVTHTAIQGMIKSVAIPDIAGSTESERFVAACLEIRDYLARYIPMGSLQPDGLSKVRFEQDNDGMFGYPVLKKGGAPLTDDIAVRLLIDSGVDTRSFVGTMVHDSNTGGDYPYRIQDALAYILDHMVASPTDLTSVVVLLARTQKHGWKMEDGALRAKPGKARAVFPNSAIQACVEAMPISAYIRAIKEAKVPCFPSIQDKPTRVDMIKRWMVEHSADGYGFLAADWSQYDATVPGWGLASIIEYCVKPFFNSKWHAWIDAVAYILCFKYYLVNDDLARIHAEDYIECNSKLPNVQIGDWRFYGLVNYLISGAKFTHIGGSLYGIAAIHLTIPSLMGFKGVIGPQAGDDTLVGVPRETIDLGSKERTYEPLSAAAKRLGLDINPGKQIFYQCQGELVGIFLQDSYCQKGELWGVGTAYRPLAALFFSERSKGLTVAEQIMAEIARMNQGADSPFVDSAVEFWLSKEQYLLVLVKERGASKAFQTLIDYAGGDINEVAQRIDVGSFTFGIDKKDLRSGTLPILNVMDRVVSKMSPEVGIAEALKSLSEGTSESTDDDVNTSELSDEAILDD
jgi:hypothetical protein